MASTSRTTGISGITGKTVYVRHATDWDMEMLEDILKEKEQRMLSVPRSQIVVAVVEHDIIGYGILEERSGGEACVHVKELGRHRGIGSVIASHLLERNPASTVTVTAGDPEIFGDMGFSRLRTGEAGKVYASMACKLPVVDGGTPPVFLKPSLKDVAA